MCKCENDIFILEYKISSNEQDSIKFLLKDWSKVYCCFDITIAPYITMPQVNQWASVYD